MEKLYYCDPNKNKTCKKTGCQVECFHTCNKEFSIDLEDTSFRLFYCSKCSSRLIETDSFHVNKCFRCGQEFNNVVSI